MTSTGSASGITDRKGNERAGHPARSCGAGVDGGGGRSGRDEPGLLLAERGRCQPAALAHAEGQVDVPLGGRAEAHLAPARLEHDLAVLLHLEASLLEAAGKPALLVAEAEALALLRPVLRLDRGAEELAG